MYQATQTLMDAYANGPYQSALLDVYLKDNTHMQLTNADIMENGLTIDRYATYNNVVTMGTCVASELNLRLNNHDGRFDGVNFTGARIYVYIDINNTTSYRVSCGEFIVDGQPRNRSEIEIVALDIMTLLDKPLTEDMFFSPNQTHTDYTPLGSALQNVTYNCTGTTSYFTTRPNVNRYINVKKLPFTDGVLTCRQFVSWAFAVMGGFGLPSYLSRTIGCRWYEQWDGDEGSNQERYICEPSNRYSLDYSNETITITGLFYKANDQSTTLIGQPDYALDFTNNPYVEGLYDSGGIYQPADPSNVINSIWDHYPDGILGYVPFSATVRPAPFLWPGDPVELVTTELAGYDEDGEPIYVESHESTTITHVTYKLNGATYIAAEGQSPEEHQTVPTTGSGTTTGANILAGNLTVAGNASFSGNVAVGAGRLLKVVRVEPFHSVSIAANTNKSDTYAITSSDIGEGWVPVCVCGYSMGQGTFNVYRLRLAVDDANTLEYSVRNIDSSAHTGSLGVSILCIRTSL